MAAPSKDAIQVRSILDRLREPFPASAVKQRQGPGSTKLDYVPIETVLNRLLEVAPTYDWLARVVSFEGGTGVAVVEGHLTIGNKTAYGVGAMKNTDADMALKSANSEAMKNAAKNGFGIALELWDAEHRKSIDRQRKAMGSPAAMKQEVFRQAKEALGKDKPTAAEIAKHFGVKAADLMEEETLRGILKRTALTAALERAA